MFLLYSRKPPSLYLPHLLFLHLHLHSSLKACLRPSSAADATSETPRLAPFAHHFFIMGGCASKPKEKKASAEFRPCEVPGSPDKAEAAQPTNVVVPAEEEKNNGGEMIQVEEPLVDISEPKQDQAAAETRDVEAEMVVSELLGNNATVNNPVPVELETKEKNKVETAETEHKEKNAMAEAEKKEEQKVKEEPVGKTQGGEIMQVGDDAPPRSSDSPLVAV